MKIGFVGLGDHGSADGRAPDPAGHQLTQFSRSSGRCEGLREQGATVVKSPAEDGGAGRGVFSMVPDTPDVENVLLEKRGLRGPGAGVGGDRHVAPFRPRPRWSFRTGWRGRG